MTAKEAISILEFHNPFLGTDKKLTEAFDMAIKALTAQQWIPCSETVDIPEHEVICCDKYGEELIGWLSCEDGQWLCESETEMMYAPVAWMEKPKPWRGES